MSEDGAPTARPGEPEPALDIRAAVPSTDPARDAYVLAHPEATFFHLSGWRSFVERTYGFEPCELLAWRGKRLVGVLPLMAYTSFFGTDHLLSMPFATYGGALADDAEVETALVARARLMGEERRVGHVELRDQHARPGDWVESSLYSTFVRELPDEPDQVLARMPKKARAEARKARNKHGLELSEGEWYVDDLSRMFLKNKHVLGSPGLPVAHFHGLQDVLGERTHVHLVRQGRRPVAAVMSFEFRDTLIAYYAGSEPGTDRAVSASNFMYMALQEWAVQKGFRVFDFCRSRADSGAYKFKLNQGFEPRPLHYRFHLVRDRKLPSFNPSNPRTNVLRATWSRLPLWTARPVSGWVMRYLP